MFFIKVYNFKENFILIDFLMVFLKLFFFVIKFYNFSGFLLNIIFFIVLL